MGAEMLWRYGRRIDSSYKVLKRLIKSFWESGLKCAVNKIRLTSKVQKKLKMRNFSFTHCDDTVYSDIVTLQNILQVSLIKFETVIVNIF
jgi:hypothetical protein